MYLKTQLKSVSIIYLVSENTKGFTLDVKWLIVISCNSLAGLEILSSACNLINIKYKFLWQPGVPRLEKAAYTHIELIILI